MMQDICCADICCADMMQASLLRSVSLAAVSTSPSPTVLQMLERAPKISILKVWVYDSNCSDTRTRGQAWTADGRHRNTGTEVRCFSGALSTQTSAAGRGLVAKQPIQYGETLHRETPMLCHPGIEHENQVCYACLRVLYGPGQAHCQKSGHVFCGPACLAAAQQSFLTVENLVNTSVFRSHCHRYGERFPLLAARQAYMHLARSLQQPVVPHSTGVSCSSRPALVAAVASAGDNAAGPSAPQNASVPLSGNALVDLRCLCFANVAEPLPKPWLDTHGQLAAALHTAAPALAATVRTPNATGAAAAAVQATLSKLDARWFASVLSRLHLNSFRVQLVLPPSADGLLQGAAASMRVGEVGGSEVSDEGGSMGSAVYLLASLFNHSCEPNVDVHFPRNNSVASFVAARDIAEGEPLCITYLDNELPVATRQAHLSWAYGFKCTCARCREEEQQDGC